jgi:hypothetical protein
VTRDGENSCVLPEMRDPVSDPEMEMVRESATLSSPRSSLKANPITDTSSTTNSFNTTDTTRQHFVTTDL